ncbi:uncharacterized protein LOC120650760 isoform X1 [Panicum virgatum]|uniref:uncharacterized protein LOC120650760 isoform X1 n=1 Tax=Panicum virgatum TaxID=38727 RepID=UPI0019D647A8|nr:uncharacterized protein LOC120650760 isoform X1 [Panicum virgatum]
MAPESCHLIRSACLPLRMSSLSTRGSIHLRALALDPCGSKASIASFLTPGAGGFLLTSSSGTLWRSTGPGTQDQTDVEQLRRVSVFSDESLLIPPHGARCHLPSPLLDNFYHRCRCFVQGWFSTEQWGVTPHPHASMIFSPITPGYQCRGTLP